MSVVLAIDPGITTGLALRAGVGSYKTLTTRKWSDIAKLIDTHADSMLSPGGLTCVIEDFTAARIDKYGLHTVRLIGAVEALTWVRGVKLYIQYPIERTPFKDEARRIVATMSGRHLVHEVDALSHLLLYEKRVQIGALEKLNKGRRVLT